MPQLIEVITVPDGLLFEDLVDHVAEKEETRKDHVRTRLTQELTSGSAAFRVILTDNRRIVEWSRLAPETAQ